MVAQLQGRDIEDVLYLAQKLELWFDFISQAIYLRTADSQNISDRIEVGSIADCLR